MAVWPIQQRNVVGIIMQLSQTEKKNHTKNSFITVIFGTYFTHWFARWFIYLFIIIIIIVIIIIIIIIIIFNLQKVWNLTSHINPRI